MRKPRSLLLLLLAGLLIAGAGAAFLKQRVPQAAALPTNAVPASAPLEFLASDVDAVQPGELRQLLRLSGSLRAVNQAVVKARVAGEVREVLVREGEPVQAGQVLVRMDGAEYLARVTQAQGALLAAQGQLDIALKARDNNRALLERGFISRNAFDNAASQYAIARANVESARGALDVAKKSLADTVIRAPIAGLISSRSVQPGEKVSPDNRLLEVVDLRQLEMEAAVPAADIAGVQVGQDVTVQVEGLSEPVTGKVTRINPATQTGSRSIPVYIQIANPDDRLRVGMFGEAQLTLAKKENVLRVPVNAVRSEAGQRFLYTIVNNTLRQQPVTLGMRGHDGEGAAVEVTSGLQAGTLIVKANLGNLRAGSLVRVQGKSDPQAAAVPPAAALAAQ